MSRSLDMSLDDIISKNGRYGGGRNSHFIGRGRSRAAFPGPDRRSATRDPTWSKPYTMRPPTMQVPEMIMVPRGGHNRDSEAKLYISNLDYGVSNDDIKVLFSDVGELKGYSVHYDRSGMSKGTAEVVFARQADALAAIKRYDDANLDGKPMKIELVGVDLVTPLPLPVPARKYSQQSIGRMGYGHGGGGEGGSSHGVVGGGGGEGRSSHGVAGGGGSGRGYARGQKQGRTQALKVTAAKLDADLDKYHSDAMQIS